MDIFKKHLWYTYKDESFKWYRLTLDQVLEIIDLNKKNKKAAPLEEYESDSVTPTDALTFEDSAGEDSLTRFDTPKRRRKKRKKKKPNQEAKVAVKTPEKKQNPQGKSLHRNKKRRPKRRPNNDKN